jgi:hypothetical protein
MPTVDPAAALARAEHLGEELRELAAQFIAVVAELAPIADEVAFLEAQYAAALNQAGCRELRPPARELLTDVVCGRLRGLAPYLRSVSTHSALRAEECVTGPLCISEPRTTRGQRTESEAESDPAAVTRTAATTGNHERKEIHAECG